MHRFVCNVKNVLFAWRKRVLFLKLCLGKVGEFSILCIGHESKSLSHVSWNVHASEPAEFTGESAVNSRSDTESSLTGGGL